MFHDDGHGGGVPVVALPLLLPWRRRSPGRSLRFFWEEVNRASKILTGDRPAFLQRGLELDGSLFAVLAGMVSLSWSVDGVGRWTPSRSSQFP